MADALSLITMINELSIFLKGITYFHCFQVTLSTLHISTWFWLNMMRESGSSKNSSNAETTDEFNNLKQDEWPSNNDNLCAIVF